MASENTKVRPWTWTPPPAMNQLMFILLRLPMVHRVISKEILLISFIGQKSGKRYSTPVGYLKEGNKIIILTKRFRQWWRNFEQPAPVELRITGRDYQGQAAALTDVETLIPIIVHIVEAHPREAEIYGIKLLDNGKPEPESLQEAVPKLVVIQVELEP